MPVPGDYDGDRLTDVAVSRPSTAEWWVLQSSTSYASYRVFGWGIGGDLPAPADYDGDGKADIAVCRPSTATWWILESRSNYMAYRTLQWGLDGDVAAPADYDADEEADLATSSAGENASSRVVSRFRRVWS